MAYAQPRFDPGKLRHRVSIQAPTQQRNEFGEVVDSWAEVAIRRASVEPLTNLSAGRETFEVNQVQAEITHRVVMRYLPGLMPDWRIVHEGRTLNIVTIRNLEERREILDVLCKEEVR